MIEGKLADKEWNELESFYEEIRRFRENSNWDECILSRINEILAILDDQYPNEWLLRLELLELFNIHNDRSAAAVKIEEMLKNTSWEKSVKQMLQRGLTLINKC
jgi:phenylalanine-4-hydroxylase